MTNPIGPTTRTAVLAAPTDGSAGRTVLVTGGARGLGRELCSQLVARGDRVIITARNHAAAQSFARQLSPDGDLAVAVELDVCDPTSIRHAVTAIQTSYQQLDVLVNNAGVDFDADQQALTADLDRVRKAMDTNLFGAWAVTQAMRPLLVRGSAVIMVSTELASLERMSRDMPGYRISKTALNALTRVLAAELIDQNLDVRAVSPGWTATDMGGEGGRPVSDGAQSILTAIDAPQGVTGTYTQDGAALPW